jgi:leucyl aminopeptidase
MIKITYQEKGEATKIKSGVLVTLLAGKKETEVVRLSSGQRVIEIGIDDPAKLNQRKLVLLARKAISLARSHRAETIVIRFSDFCLPKLALSDERVAELLGVNFEMANFEFVAYKTPPEEGWIFVQEIVVLGKVSPEVRRAFARGQMVGEETNKCRILANTPGGEMTPRLLANEARKAAGGLPIAVTILGRKDIEKLKMGGVLGVSKGSTEEPRFIIMEYWGGAKKDQPIVFCGKGVTFDTGGLNLKPTQHIYEMHMDMSGGAAVVHALVAAARLGIKKNIIALVPAVENMPSGSSYHPGDVLVSLSGKTIEVLDTDAEGRIVLADALTYAKKYRPRLVVDVATLTGAAMVAVGQRASVMFTRDEHLERMFRELGEESGDYVWPLPLWEEYDEDIKGTFGDIANTGKGRYGGAIHGASFLQQFADGYPLVHLDIAPRMTAIEGEHLAKGAAGAPVRLLVKLLERY